MSRPEGIGAIKFINREEHDSFTVRRMLHTNSPEPTRDALTMLFLGWRNLVTQRDDCAQRIASKIVPAREERAEHASAMKLARKALKRFNAE
ncbi:MAG: hypothetical protein ABI871_05575, partial [Chthoniobacterales bacterium]